MSMSDPLNHLGSIWYHSEPSNIPYPQISFLVGTFVATSYSKIALISPKKYCEIPANNYKKQKKKPISNF